MIVKIYLICIFVVFSFVCSCLAEDKILCVSASNGLKYTNNDARLVGKAFGRYVGFSRSNIKILTGARSTKKNISEHIGQWLSKDVTKNDIVVVFFAGHGFLLNDEYYFIPETTHPLDNLNAVAAAAKSGAFLSSRELTKMINAVNTQNKLLVIDSCHSGGFYSCEKKAFRGIERMKNARQIVRGICLVDEKNVQDKGNNVAPMFTVLAASKSNQIAQEDIGLKNGVLTYYLVKVLKEKAWRQKGFFDSEKITSEIVKQSQNEGWDQEAVSTGGSFFKAPLASDMIQPFSTF